jgi:hypothetical protein
LIQRFLIQDYIQQYDIDFVLDKIDKIFILCHTTLQNQSTDVIIQKMIEYDIPIEKIIFIQSEKKELSSWYHIQALQIAIEQKYQHIWILEESFTFHVSKDHFYQYLTYFFNQNISWDIVMLALNVSGSEHKVEKITNKPFIQKIIFSQNQTSYLISQHYYQTLLENIQESYQKLLIHHQHWLYSLDVYWKSLQEKDQWYSFTEEIIQHI